VSKQVKFPHVLGCAPLISHCYTRVAARRSDWDPVTESARSTQWSGEVIDADPTSRDSPGTTITSDASAGSPSSDGAVPDATTHADGASADSADEQVEVTGCTIDGGGHCWFGSSDCGTGGGTSALAIVGNNSNFMMNTEQIWAFFRRLSR